MVVEMPDADVWVLDAVEERRLDHGVVDHIEEDDLVAYLERFVETVVSDDITGEASVSAQAVFVLLFAGHAGAEDHRAVRHFKAVRHVSAHGNVQNGDVLFVADNVFDGGDEFARLPAHGFARFKNDLNARVAAVEAFQDGNQTVDFVIGAGNMMATAKVYPLHLRNEFAEAFFKVLEDRFESVRVLFAKGVEVQAFDAFEQVFAEFLAGDAQTGILAAGVVNVGVDG